jgi:hypothetical protein
MEFPYVYRMLLPFATVEASQIMPISDETISKFRELLAEAHGVTIRDEEARESFTRLLLLYWTLAHRPPAPGASPWEPPPPPWI